MNDDSILLLSSAYFAPIEYFSAIEHSKNAKIEKFENYQKQSYRTRCHIYSANGLLVLTLPVKRQNSLSLYDEQCGESTHKLPIQNIIIDYSKPWVLQHTRALEAAYGNSPFFEYYKDDIFAILHSGQESLLKLNLDLTMLICNLLSIKTPIEYTSEYFELVAHNLNSMSSIENSPQEIDSSILDLRTAIHPKIKYSTQAFRNYYIEKPYYQVFSSQHGFLANLSILDLLFNEGPNAISFL